MNIKHKKIIDSLIEHAAPEELFTHASILLSLMSKFGKGLTLIHDPKVLGSESQPALQLYRLIGASKFMTRDCREMIRYLKSIVNRDVARVSTIPGVHVPVGKASLKQDVLEQPGLCVTQQSTVYKRTLQGDIQKMMR